MNANIRKFEEMISKSDNIVFFGGAGVSTESGIPDFRSVDGLYSQKYKYPPEQILSHSFFESKPEEFFEFYRDKLVLDDVEPNRAHYRLAELESQGKLRAVVTQNIDGLHQMAGSKNVFELHGSIHRCYCAACGESRPAAMMNDGKGVPLCSCGGTLRPDVVLYEEGLNNSVVSGAVHFIRQADMLIVGGTSLVVYPAAGLINYYEGDKLVLINRDATSYDNMASLIIREKIGEVFAQV